MDKVSACKMELIACKKVLFAFVQWRCACRVNRALGKSGNFLVEWALAGSGASLYG